MEDLKICLLVHGVPQGHKIWGDCPTNDDKAFLPTFYNNVTVYDVAETMKVDIYNGNCYYTFIKGMNVNAADNRPGSYFALTLKTNNYYADVQNIYYILKKAYEKMCIRMCVKEDGVATTFIVTDFQSIAQKLNAMQMHVRNYIEQFSVVPDVMPLPGIAEMHSNACPRLNLHECDAKTALHAMKNSGSLMVSPYYPAASVEKLLEQERKKMNDKINSVKEACTSKVNQAQTEKQTSDEERNKLKKDLEDANTKLNKKSLDFNDLLSKVQNFVREMQAIIPGNDNKAVLSYSKNASKDEKTKVKETEKKQYKNIGRYIPLVSLILLILISCFLFLISCFLFYSNNKVGNRLDSVEGQMKVVKKDVARAVIDSLKKDTTLSVSKVGKPKDKNVSKADIQKDKNNTQRKQ